MPNQKRWSYSDDIMNRIRVIHHNEDGRWWAESPDVPEWFATADTYRETHQLAEDGIRFAVDRDDVAIEHFVPADMMAAADLTSPTGRAAAA